MINKRSLSVIVISWNTKQLLQDCIESFAKYHSNLDYELIIIDNDSTDGSREYLMSLQSEEIQCLYNQENVGFAEANNQGFELAKGEFIALVNTDIRFSEDVFSILINKLKADPQLGAISTNLAGDDGKSQTIHRRFPTPLLVFFVFTRLGQIFDKRVFNNYFNKKYRYLDISRAGQQPVQQAAAALLVLNPVVAEKLEYLLDNRFPIYGNDVDLCKRIYRKGYRVDVVFDITVWHKGSASLSQMESEYKNITKKRWIVDYYTKYYGKLVSYLIQLLIR